MTFYIKIKISYKDYRLKVEQIFLDERTEQYKISSKSQPIILESNRPLFRNRGLKSRRPDWKTIEKPLNVFPSFIKEIIIQIEKVIDKPQV